MIWQRISSPVLLVWPLKVRRNLTSHHSSVKLSNNSPFIFRRAPGLLATSWLESMTFKSILKPKTIPKSPGCPWLTMVGPFQWRGSKQAVKNWRSRQPRWPLILVSLMLWYHQRIYRRLQETWSRPSDCHVQSRALVTSTCMNATVAKSNMVNWSQWSWPLVRRTSVCPLTPGCHTQSLKSKLWPKMKIPLSNYLHQRPAKYWCTPTTSRWLSPTSGLSASSFSRTFTLYLTQLRNKLVSLKLNDI